MLISFHFQLSGISNKTRHLTDSGASAPTAGVRHWSVLDFSPTGLGRSARKRSLQIFGRMMIEPIVQVESGVKLQTAIAVLTKITEYVEIVRWIELPPSVLLFLLIPGDPESGAVCVLDRKNGTWYSVDFEDEQFGGCSLAQFENLLKDREFLRSHCATGAFGLPDCSRWWSPEPRQKRRLTE